MSGSEDAFAGRGVLVRPGAPVDRLVRLVAARIPQELKELRGKMMLESLAETLGVQEVRCPACGSSGWLDREALEACPVCAGFLEVPDRLADWFKAQMCRATEEPVRRPFSPCPRGPVPPRQQYGEPRRALGGPRVPVRR